MVNGPSILLASGTCLKIREEQSPRLRAVPAVAFLSPREVRSVLLRKGHLVPGRKLYPQVHSPGGVLQTRSALVLLTRGSFPGPICTFWICGALAHRKPPPRSHL